MSGATYIGRVVWMGVALGIGAAVLTQCGGVACATPSDSPSKTTSSSGTSSAGGTNSPSTTRPQTPTTSAGPLSVTGSASTGPSRFVTPPGVDIVTHGVQHRSASTAPVAGTTSPPGSTTGTGTSTSRARAATPPTAGDTTSAVSPPARGAPRNPAGAATGRLVTSTSAPGVQYSPATSSPPRRASDVVVAAAPTVAAAAPTALASAARTVSAEAVTTPASTPAVRVPTVARVAATYVSTVVDFVLNPLAAPGRNPAPVDSPAMWTVLGWVRRELFNDPTGIDAGSGATAQPALVVNPTAVTASEPAAPALAATAPALAPGTARSLLRSLIDAAGTAVFNAYNAVFAVVAGPPVLPPGSTVTVDVSTLQYDNGYTAPADWYFPAGSNPQGLIYLQHGFLASAPLYSYTAATLAQDTDSIVVAPTITSNFFAANGAWLGGAPMEAAAADLFVGDRAALTASASAAAGHPVTLPQRVVLVGHSLGGGFVVATAADMVHDGAAGNLAGVVLFDGVSFQPGLLQTELDTLPASTPVLLIASPPYAWNLWGQMGTALVTARPGQFVGVQLVGGRHIDSMQGGNPLIQLGAYLIAGFSRPRNIDAVKILASGWINDMFAGTHDGIYASPGQTLQIPTDAGTATAISLPAPPTPLSPVDTLEQTLFTTLLEPLIGDLAPSA